MRLLTLTFLLIAAGFFLMMAGLLRGPGNGTAEFLLGGGLASLGALAAAALAGKTIRESMKKEKKEEENGQ
ncbi:MAG: hypothetical protein QNJ45_24985 [Ardenticatenaceae bacterium]|nr:hypothetical protein [Ardenticatenaceae bacterium]